MKRSSNHTRFRRLFFTLASLTAAVGLVSLGACHDWKNSTDAEKAAHIAKRATAKLDLTADQSAALEALIKDVLAVRAESLQKHGTVASQMQKLMQEDTVSPESLEQIYRNRLETIDPHVSSFSDRLAALLNSMNAEQREQLVKLMAKFDRHRHG